jgi:hypothetical protein
MFWVRGRKCKGIAARFVSALNAHDVEAIRDLVTEDFTYIDSWRAGVVGRDAVMEGTRRLFADDPGFRLEVESTSFSDPYVLMRGWVRSDNPEVDRLRATWRARCTDDRIDEWQAWAQTSVTGLARAYSPEVAQDMSDVAPENPGTA